MYPEILVSHVILSMCGERLAPVVDDEPGPAGPWLVGQPDAEPRLRDLLTTVDPAVLLLVLCGWRSRYARHAAARWRSTG